MRTRTVISTTYFTGEEYSQLELSVLMQKVLSDEMILFCQTYSHVSCDGNLCYLISSTGHLLNHPYHWSPWSKLPLFMTFVFFSLHI